MMLCHSLLKKSPLMKKWLNKLISKKKLFSRKILNKNFKRSKLACFEPKTQEA